MHVFEYYVKMKMFSTIGIRWFIYIYVETLVVLIMNRTRTSLYPDVCNLSRLDFVVMKRKFNNGGQQFQKYKQYDQLPLIPIH